MANARSSEQLQRDAFSIWQAGVAAVDSRRLVENALRVDGDDLFVGTQRFSRSTVGRIVIVGAGKAGAAMGRAAVERLQPLVDRGLELDGWINVPECEPLSTREKVGPVTLYPARPAGRNFPTQKVLDGTVEILERVRSVQPHELCLCLISGGGSALLSLPEPPVSLNDKIRVSEFLSGAGANIDELNTVRKQISRVKGGRLAAECKGKMVTMIVSDVLGDPLDLIASGPTVGNSTTAADAIRVLERYDAGRNQVPPSVYQVLEKKLAEGARELAVDGESIVIGNNETAVLAAVEQAKSLGYRPKWEAPTEMEGAAEEIGISLIETAPQLASEGNDCFISGGEPTVALVAAERRGKGGRNQQLVLAALARFVRLVEHERDAGDSKSGFEKLNFCLLSAGTDGEDGPTDAAGAWITGASKERAEKLGLEFAQYLKANDAFNFFDPIGGLIRTGPTGTNVCDLRVVLVDRGG